MDTTKQAEYLVPGAPEAPFKEFEGYKNLGFVSSES